MTRVMSSTPTRETRISKSQFKARALEFFREVERTGRALIVTDHGRPVLRIVPYRDDPKAAFTDLKESVVRYDAPTEPVGSEDWESSG